jgi:hypothetical protein
MTTTTTTMRRKYSLHGRYVELVSSWDAVLEWSDLCLLPYLKIGSGQQKIAKIICHYDVAEPLTTDGEHKTVRIHLQREAEADVVDDHHLTLRTRAGVVYKVADDVIEIFYPTKTEDSLRDPARVCREIVYNSLPVGSWYHLHASAVARNGKAIVFTGNGGAGKTTLVCRLLANKHHNGIFDFVSNDQVWIDVSTRPMKIIGSPFPIRLGYGAMISTPELAASLHLYKDHFQLINKNWKTKVHQYSVKEFAGFFGRNICTEAEVSAIVQLKPGQPQQLNAVENELEKLDAIREAARDNADTYPNWMNIGKCPAERSADDIVLNPVPCAVYELGFNPVDGQVSKAEQALLKTLQESSIQWIAAGR